MFFALSETSCWEAETGNSGDGTLSFGEKWQVDLVLTLATSRRVPGLVRGDRKKGELSAPLLCGPGTKVAKVRSGG